MISAFVIEPDKMQKILVRGVELCVRVWWGDVGDYHIGEKVALKNSEYEPDHDAPVYAEVTKILKGPKDGTGPSVVLMFRRAQHLFPHQHSVQ